MKIRKFTEISNELRNDWEMLWRNSPYANIVNSPAWTLAANKAFNYKDLLIISVYNDRGTDLLAIAAFVKEKIFGVPMWTAPGVEFSDKCSILADLSDRNVMSSLVPEIVRLGFVYLPHCTQDEIKKMQEFMPKSKTLKSDVNLYMDFSKGKYGKYSNKKIKNLLNRIENSKTQLDFVTSNCANNNGALETCFRIDVASVKHSKGRGVFYKPEAREFYRALAELSPESVPLSILYLNNKPVSYLIAFLVNNVYTTTQKAYLEGFEYYNPGKLTLMKLIDHYEKELPMIEFGRGCDQSKRSFTSSFYVLYNLIISKNALVPLYISTMHDFHTKAYESISSNPRVYCLYKKVKEAVALFFCVKLLCCYEEQIFGDVISVNL